MAVSWAFIINFCVLYDKTDDKNVLGEFPMDKWLYGRVYIDVICAKDDLLL